MKQLVGIFVGLMLAFTLVVSISSSASAWIEFISTPDEIRQGETVDVTIYTSEAPIGQVVAVELNKAATNADGTIKWVNSWTRMEYINVVGKVNAALGGLYTVPITVPTVYPVGTKMIFAAWVGLEADGRDGTGNTEFERRYAASGTVVGRTRTLLPAIPVGLTETAVNTLVGNAIAVDNVGDDEALEAALTDYVKIDELADGDFITHTHDKGSGSRMTSGPIIDLD